MMELCCYIDSQNVAQVFSPEAVGLALQFWAVRRPPLHFVGAVAFRWEPPHLCGGGALQRSENFSRVPLRLSAGPFGGSPRIYPGEEHFSAPKTSREYRCALALARSVAAPAFMKGRSASALRKKVD